MFLPLSHINVLHRLQKSWLTLLLPFFMVVCSCVTKLQGTRWLPSTDLSDSPSPQRPCAMLLTTQSLQTHQPVSAHVKKGDFIAEQKGKKAPLAPATRAWTTPELPSPSEPQKPGADRDASLFTEDHFSLIYKRYYEYNMV